MSRTEQRHQLLELLGDKISEPERTDFNLDRWLEAYDEVNDVSMSCWGIQFILLRMN